MSQNPIVSTENGKVRGKLQTDYHGGTFYSFRGIPYAKAPVGNLRFKAPQPADSWEGILDGTKEGWECPSVFIPSFIHIGREDNCLNLNVYTKEVWKGNVGMKPVMMFIHGGSYLFCSNRSFLYGPDYLMTEDIVLVVINYRLGVLGFLSLEDQSLDVPGNAGLKDQVMALKWIQNNIHNFGGDAGNVTIFGESAGSASVHYLTLSPLTKGLFHKAIMQSGSAFDPWARGRRNGTDIARLMNYDTNMDEKTLLQKLRQASQRSLINAQLNMADDDTKWGSLLFASVERPFTPVIEYLHEGAFLCEDPEEIIRSGRNHQIPMIIGYTSSEGMLYTFLRKTICYCSHPQNLQRDVPHFLKITPGSEKSREIAEEIGKFYYKDEPVGKNDEIRHRLFGDILFVHGIQKTIKLSRKHGIAPVFVYRMSVSSSLNFFKDVCRTNHPYLMLTFSLFIKLFNRFPFKNNLPNLEEKLLMNPSDGVCHGDDMLYLFKSVFSPNVLRHSEEDLYIERFVKLWTNFARCADPTPELDGIFDNTKWKPNCDENINDILDIGKHLEITENLENGRISFLERLYEKYAS